jgi:tripartite-type tricarboxylate transporter receptor subunit TctC
MPDVKNRLLEIGAEPVANTPEQMAARIKEETLKFAQIAKQANVTLE